MFQGNQLEITVSPRNQSFSPNSTGKRTTIETVEPQMIKS